VKSSVADGAYDNDVEALMQMRRMFDFLPAVQHAKNRRNEPTDDGSGSTSARHADPGQSEQAL
jgi:acetyl-CoA carboxylase carboxyltransferase component